MSVFWPVIGKNAIGEGTRLVLAYSASDQRVPPTAGDKYHVAIQHRHAEISANSGSQAANKILLVANQ
jgi:hypothetical protein